jgi:endo-1,4-beta-D-glucanase Y
MTASGPAGGQPLPGPVCIPKYGAATFAVAALFNDGVARMSRPLGAALALVLCFLLSAVPPLACAAAAPPERWPLWEAYISAFLDSQGRVIDPQGAGRTTSEGQSYGMFFALVANDRDRFGRLLNWTANNLADGDLGTRLPSWLWGKDPAGQWKVLDENSAADADLWIAYTLCEAGRLWRQPQYDSLGKRMMALIAAGEVVELPGFGTTLLPGRSGFHPTPDSWLLNPSYLPLPLLTRFAVLNPQGPWRGIAAGLPSLLEKSARRGFAMDWVSYSAKDGFQPARLPGTSAAPGGSYDAIRVYLWAGLTHPETPGRGQSLAAVPGMANYLAMHASPPERVDAAGMAGSNSAPVGFSAALLPYLQATGAKSAQAAQAARLAAQLDPATSLYGRPPVYYDENLTLFGLGGRQRWFIFGRDGELQLRWGQK